MIIVINKFEPVPAGVFEVDTTSAGPFKDLSPFYLGPYSWTESNLSMQAVRMENLWQYSKVYPQHVDTEGNILQSWFQWRDTGFKSTRANRYPMGKGAKPLCTRWMGQRLTYIEARKALYIPVYSELVLRTRSYAMLYEWVMKGTKHIALRDFDGYRHIDAGMTLKDVINNSAKSMGHAFIIYGLLTGELREAML